ncbi:MAG: hypothetical protein H7Y06_08555 [Opitutaceae bacterium]|nr:hypothetical protein [Opitutaceae bacterium]
MSLSSLKRFLPKPPPRQVVLLSDTLFFTRAVPVTEGATAAEVAAQAELAVESLSPFPVAQLYYGHHWLPGSAHALVYAAYRKRLTADDVAMWPEAEVVLPIFVTVLRKGETPAPATAVIVPGAGSVTGLYFADAGGVPTVVRVEPLIAEATDADRAAARDTVLAAFPEKLKVIDVEAEPVFDLASPQGEFVFRAGVMETSFDAADVAPLDVRDKGELAARRRAQARDVILWRSFLGCAAAIGVAILLEFTLVGTAIWQKQRLALEATQKPVVEAVMTSQTLATQIDELSTKRLRPLEMLALVNTARPRTIQFMRLVTNGLQMLEVEAQTSSSGDIDVLRSALNKLPGCEKAEVLDPRSRDGVSTFKLVVTFKPDAFKEVPVPAVAPEATPEPATAPAATETKPEEQT